MFARALRSPLVLGVMLAACSGDPQPPAVSDTGVSADAAPDTLADAAVDSAIDSPTETGPAAFSEKLSEMDLYADIASKTIAAGNVLFQPTYELWSDGAEKKRWIALPAGSQIDNADMDHWQFPVGTRVWKEFIRDGKRLETRLVERTGADSYRYGTYLWNDAETEATWTTSAASNVRGTTHDIPKEADCQRCHDGEPGRVLGFSAIQLAKASPLDLASIASWLKVAPAAGREYGAPGNAVEAAALGILHANCGNCHNPNDALTFIAAGTDLRLYVDQREVATTTLYTSNVNQTTEKFTSLTYRIEGGNAEQSAIWARMNRRDNDQMPPLGTEAVHAAGLTALRAWIETLPRP